MSHLSRRAAELVRAGREAGRATEADCERNLAALRARLGAGPLPPEMIRAHAPRRVSRLAWPMAAVLVAALGAGAALAVTMRKQPARVEPVDAKPAPQVEIAPPVPKEIPRSEPSAVIAPPVVETGAATPHRPPRDRLAEEVAILSRAANCLEAGRASDALRAIDEHQRKFPNGVLREERYAARVQALCALGRSEEAAAELARLSRLAPDSPHTARARQSCAAATAGSSAAGATGR